MKVQILGGGCVNCDKLQANTKKALENMGLQVEIEKVKDFKEIMALGVMRTPALVVDNKVILSGRVAKAKEIEKLIHTL